MHLFQQLDNDWTQVIAGSDGHRACLRWNRINPVLAHIRCPEQLVQEIRRAHEPVRSDELLSAIVALAPSDQMAARVVLQALIPGLRMLERKLRTLADPEEVEAVIVAASWTRIRTYPHDRRPRCIAANILLDTRKDTLRQLQPSADVSAAPEPADTELDVDLHSLLRSAEKQGLISPSESDLIAATRILGETLAAAGTRFGATSEALRKRRSRAEARLRLVPH